LRDLFVAGNNIGPDGMKQLAQSPYLSRLTTLGVFNNSVKDEGVNALEEATFAGSLRALYLGSNHLTAGGIASLARSVRFPRLRCLGLDQNGSPFDDKAVQAMTESPAFAALQNLTLEAMNLTESQIAALRRRFAARLYLLPDADYF